MANFANDFRTNYDAITARTKGAAPANQILLSATLLTIFEAVESWVKPDSVKRMTAPPSESEA